jgi:hypothetical protein
MLLESHQIVDTVAVGCGGRARGRKEDVLYCDVSRVYIHVAHTIAPLNPLNQHHIPQKISSSTHSKKQNPFEKQDTPSVAPISFGFPSQLGLRLLLRATVAAGHPPYASQYFSNIPFARRARLASASHVLSFVSHPPHFTSYSKAAAPFLSSSGRCPRIASMT